MTNDDLDRLEQIAKAAAPGPWEACGCRVESASGDPLGLIIYDEGGHNEADAAHIAAFNPQTALRLLAEVTRLTTERDALAQQVEALTAQSKVYEDAVTEWRPIVEQVEAAQQDAARLREALRMLQSAVLDATDDAENCEECGIVADSTDTDETACAIHRSQPIWRALLAAWEVLGPCVCGHPRSQHREEDSAACLTCACEWFKLPDAQDAALTAPADPTGGQ